MLEALLETGNSPNGPDCPLIGEVQEGNLECVQLLLKGGEHPNSSKFDDRSALKVAIETDDVAMYAKPTGHQIKLVTHLTSMG